MPLPVIANVFRVALEWAPAPSGVSAVNTFHVRSDAPADAGDVLGQVQGRLDDHHDMWLPLHTGSAIARVSVLPLDGSTATVFGTGPSGLGSGSGADSPASAFIMSIATGQRGPRGRGRIYIGPCTEDAIGNGGSDGAMRATMQTAWNDFATDLDAFGGPVAVHFGVASYVHADFHSSSALVVESLLGTMRRRQDQLR